MNRKNVGYLPEMFLLGMWIYLGMGNIDIAVNVNVTDKPIITSVENAENVSNTERP